jgi:hypothetical protein
MVSFCFYRPDLRVWRQVGSSRLLPYLHSHVDPALRHHDRRGDTIRDFYDDPALAAPTIGNWSKEEEPYKMIDSSAM